MGAADNNPLLVAVTDLVNLLLHGRLYIKAPLTVRGALFRATVLVIFQEARWHPSNSSGLSMACTVKVVSAILVGSETTGICSIWGSGMKQQFVQRGVIISTT